VGNDVCPNGIRPAQSKHKLFLTWPRLEIVGDIAKFIGFAQFHSIYINHFKLRITPLRDITTKHDYTEMVVPHWTDKADNAFKDIQQAILSNPCSKGFNHRHLVVISTDFSSVGFCVMVCQPATEEASEAGMLANRSGKGFAFMSKDSSAALHPVAFGGQRCRSNEHCLHSHLGKGFAGDRAINKNCRVLFGTRFMWFADCYAIHFILSYEGNNPSILCLQNQLLCWDIDIVH
jgi:hypothetical protein